LRVLLCHSEDIAVRMENEVNFGLLEILTPEMCVLSKLSFTRVSVLTILK
jgi:hypothetical protein